MMIVTIQIIRGNEKGEHNISIMAKRKCIPDGTWNEKTQQNQDSHT